VRCGYSQVSGYLIHKLRGLDTTKNIITAIPLAKEEGNRISWVIIQAIRKVTFDDALHVFHRHESSEDHKLESGSSNGDMEDNRHQFSTGMLAKIHGFHGKYAIISLSPDDMGNEAPQYLYWVDTKLLEIPPSLTSKAYHARLLHPSFSLRIYFFFDQDNRFQYSGPSHFYYDDLLFYFHCSTL